MTNKEILKELQEFMKKHQIVIEVDYGACSDLYGVYDQQTVISIKNEEALAVDGWGIDHTDFDEEEVFNEE